jgi:hypothetical protein
MRKHHNKFTRGWIVQLIVTIALLAYPSWAWAVTVSSKKLSRAISNHQTTVATISGVAVSWPSSNGKLLKIKLDGDVIWDKKSPAGATSLTIPASALTKDDKKKSIKTGQNRIFTLEFERTADTNLNNYTLTIHFRSSCSLSAPPWSGITDLLNNFS